MKPSLWAVRVGRGFGDAWPDVVGERSLDLGEGICLGWFVAIYQAMCSADAVFGCRWKGSGDLAANMTNELWQDRKTANDDAYCELGPTPKTHEFQVIGSVRWFGNLKAVVSAHDGCHAGPTK